MDPVCLIEELRRPEAYPFPVDRVEVRQTHISVVFLAGPFAYKVKKPVDLGFLDFTTLELRRRFCHEEVRLNRRLAPDVYLGVVPVASLPGGSLELEGGGPVVEHAVKMRRLPDEATLLARLRGGRVRPETLETLGRRIAAFHQAAASGPEVAAYGRFHVVAGNARENLEQSTDHVGLTLSEAVHTRLMRVLEDRLHDHHDLIEQRAADHVPRDTHGDMHLDHVYLFPDEPAPRDLVVIDCIEFAERFRYADPVADMAFLVMDLLHHGYRDLATAFGDAYFEAAGDREGIALLPFYVAYRAAVRGKVEGMASLEDEIPEEQRQDAARAARAHWLLALSQLEEPSRRPCLVLLGGLPGTGKSTVAEGLARRAGFRVVSSDRVRKELAGLAPDASARAAFGEGLYTPEWNDRTYTACLERAGELLHQGERVVVDASFREAARRRAFAAAAVTWGVRASVLVCTASPEVVRSRLARRRGDPSDADWSVYVRAAEAWETPEDDPSGPRPRLVPTDGTVDEAVESAIAGLREAGLA